MSRLLEAGKGPEESIPLVVIDRIKISDEDDIDGTYICSGPMDTPRLEIETGNGADFVPKLKSNVLLSDDDNLTDEEEIKYKIDICETECEGAFNFMKMRAKPGEDEVADDAARYLEIFSTKFDTLEAVICVDDEHGIADSGAELLGKFIQETSGSILLLTNGLTICADNNNSIDKIASVVSTSVTAGEAVTRSAYDRKYRGVLDHNLRTESDAENQIHNMIDCVLLLDEASRYDVLRYKLAILKEIRKLCFHCVKLLLDGSREILLSMGNGAYFEDNTGILVPKNTGYLSSKLYSFLEACKAELRHTYLAQIDLILAFQKYLSDNDCIDVDKIFENMKRHLIKFHAFDDTEDTMDDALGNAIVKGLDLRINFLLDTSEAVLNRISDPSYFRNNLVTLVFKECGGFPLLLANYLQDCVYMEDYNKQKQHFEKILEMCDDESFIENINQNTAKLKVLDENGLEQESMNLISTVRDALSRWVSNDSMLQMGGTLTFKDFTLIEVMAALRFNRPDALKRWLHMQADIDTYIFCNLRFHWYDLDKRGESKVANRFKLLAKGKRDQQGLLHLGRNINIALDRLSDGIIADCFEEDGSPNVRVISPIQALILNRVFCMQFEFVKMLWEFDKQNIIVNAVMIWILVTGILKLKIFARESGSADLVAAKKYFAKAIQRPLDQLLVMFPDTHFEILRCRAALFRGKSLYHLAGDGKFFRFLCHTVTKRCISAEWKSAEQTVPKLKYLEELEDRSKSKTNCTIFLRKPRIKLYVHMTMHVLSYLMLAYYTLQPNHAASAILKWTLFIVISSLIIDELRQALGGKQYTIRSSLKRWWSDNWNKLDLLSMVLYYVAFSLELGGAVQASRLLFSTFTFIWCLKFYQFLRAFQSLGTYIILVQKMLLHLNNFLIVAGIAVVSYGVFMTSLLFPGVNFGSWTIFVMILLRPYLLFFAETGIEEYDISNKSTIYLTPKVDRASEILTILGMCVFLMFGGVLLLNLLIAIFSGIYEEVKAKSEKLWALNDLQLLQEFKCKPSVPVPFSLPINIFLILRRLISKVEVFLIIHNDNDLALKIYQQDIAERRYIQHAEPSLDSIILGIEVQMSECRERIESIHQELIGTVNDKSEELVEEMQRASEETARQVDEHARRMMEGVEAKLQAVQGKMERKMADEVRKSSKETNQRIKNVESRCEEIAALLKQLVESKKET